MLKNLASICQSICATSTFRLSTNGTRRISAVTSCNSADAMSIWARFSRKNPLRLSMCGSKDSRDTKMISFGPKKISLRIGSIFVNRTSRRVWTIDLFSSKKSKKICFPTKSNLKSWSKSQTLLCQRRVNVSWKEEAQPRTNFTAPIPRLS